MPILNASQPSTRNMILIGNVLNHTATNAEQRKRDRTMTHHELTTSYPADNEANNVSQIARDAAYKYTRLI